MNRLTMVKLHVYALVYASVPAQGGPRWEPQLLLSNQADKKLTTEVESGLFAQCEHQPRKIDDLTSISSPTLPAFDVAVATVNLCVDMAEEQTFQDYQKTAETEKKTGKK